MLVLKKTYDAKVAELEIVSDILSETQAAERRLSVGINDWRARATHWEAKFKLAATDLAAQAEEIAALREAAHREGVRLNELASDRDNWRRECLKLRPDAQKWRDYLKRSRDRKAGKKS